VSSVDDELVQAALKNAQRGRADRAVRDLEKVLRSNPDHAIAARELGLLLNGLGRSSEALARLKRAAELSPTDAATNRAVASVARGLGQLEVAADAWRRIVALAPADASAQNELAVVLQEQAKLDDAVDHFRAALSIQPRSPQAHSNLLLCLNYHEAWSDDRLFAEHEAFGRLYSGDESPPPVDPGARDAPPRIGYLSPDFFSHSVPLFILPVLSHHDRSRVHVTCYSDVRKADEVTALCRGRADAWRETTQLNDDELARQILADRIDILVDLAGHTLHNRLPMLARQRLAAVQATYLGYPNTTGLRTIDYRITDAIADPAGVSDALHTERLVRLPNSFFTVVDIAGTPDPIPLPAAKNGHVTFAVATNFSKVRPPMLRLWARIVTAVPGSRLLLQSRSLADPPTREATLQILAAAGLSADRVELRGWTDFEPYLRMLGDVDIVLDTFPFNGHTTTYQALWMAAPVVTLCGPAAHRSRMGASILTNLDLAELIAHTEDDYVRIATGLATNLSRLGSLRSGLRERMRASPLMDGTHFTRHLEDAYAAMLAGRNEKG
jgi:predicted O-linked N-acetylglucosamine transferase (SPINDLY family)